MKKVLILGSGPLKIAQAGEFDYSGSQAIKALKEEGIETILINPNIATIQTSDFLADQVYFLPVTPHFVEKVIQKEKPDGVLLAFGGQTALNCGIELYKKGVFEKYNIKVLGTSVESIILSEDRKKFANHLKKLHIYTPISKASKSTKDALEIAKEIGYPVMVRAAYTLGGQKSGVAYNEKELNQIASNALRFAPQILVEQYLHHYKEVEYEVVRDIYDNCVTVCNMENMDPLGIHTGESIVVAPSQTLTNYEYQVLRKKSIEIARSLKIVGECNVQFALNPHPKQGEIEYYVIELNARLSRSSALASKATGYPLAYVAAKLALGKGLTEIKNQVTQVTQSFFEPALDYLIVKFPRWDLNKFKRVQKTIGSSMKSVGEVMAIGRTFEEAIQQAIRMLDQGVQGTENAFKSIEDILYFIKTPTPQRIFAIAEGIRRGISIKQIHDLSGIDQWFLYRIQAIVDLEESLRKNKDLSKEAILKLKQAGVSDKRIGFLVGKTELEIRKKRKEKGIVPYVFQIDTLAGEVPAHTNYLYMTYNGSHHDVTPLHKKGVIILGAGPYRIGSSVEFDWSCVSTARACQKYNKKSIVVNCNPETVSTDYDISDRLYFDQLTLERILDIYEFEESEGLILSVGGQTPNNLASQLAEYGVRILGTQADQIDRAEDRSKFSALLDTLSIPQPLWDTFENVEDVKAFAKKVEYPVLIRPSYVLSGSAMNVCYNESDLKLYLAEATANTSSSIIVSKFIQNAKEIEYDAIAVKGEIKIYAISEHLEAAGVHSGDASIVYPPQRLFSSTEKEIIEIAKKLSKALKITGPFNIQFIAKENKVFVIEMNLRASRTLPFISKAMKINFPELFVDGLFSDVKVQSIVYPKYVIVKVPQFSFSRLEGADPMLRVEMASTGEAACFGEDIEEALLKAELSIGATVPKKGIFVSLGGEENKVRFLDGILRLKELGVPLYATEKTAEFMQKHGVKATVLCKIFENKEPNPITFFEKKKIDLAINIPGPTGKAELEDGYLIRRAAIDYDIPLLTDRQKAMFFIKALIEKKSDDLLIKSWKEYV